MLIFKKGLIIALFIILITISSLNVYSIVLINEIMYDPSPSQGSDAFNEWVEIFNNGNSSIDLTNATLCGDYLLKGFINRSDNNTRQNTTFILESFSFALITDGGTGTDVYNNFSVESNALAFHVSMSSMCSNGLSNSGEIINLTIGNNSHIINYTQFVALFPSTSDNGKTLIFYKGNFTESAFINGAPGSSNDQFAPDSNKWISPSKNNSFISGLFNISVNITDVTNVSSVLVSFNNTNFSMTKNRDIWYFLWNTMLNIPKQYNITIYFNDTYGKSNFDMLFNITINNTNIAPAITSANITNTDFLNRTNGTLQAFFSFTDFDNDAITANETLWYINNTLITNYTNKTFIHPINTTKLENWTFSVRVFDGFNWSDFANSSKITILNAKPAINITTLSITLQETQLVNISLNADDLDNDPLTFSSNKSEFSISSNALLWYTNLTSSGAYTINISVNDSLETDSAIANVTIIDARDLDNDNNPDFNDTDDDNDNIPDENDFLTGNLSSINTTLSLSVAINGTSNLSKLFNGTFAINISNGTHPIIEFNFTFNSSNILDFGNITINRTTSGSSAVAIRGLRLFTFTKTIFLEKINTTVKAVCIKDADAGFDAISSSCDSANETLLICDNATSGQYTCFDTGTRYRIIGLSHSAVKELCVDKDGDGYGNGCVAGTDCNDNDASKRIDSECNPPSSGSSGSSGGGSGGGGGGGIICISNWRCEEWLQCINGSKNRKCSDTNQCTFPTNKPIVSQQCVNEDKEILSNVINSLEPINKTTKEIKQEVSTRKLNDITGQAVGAKLKANKKFNLGVFIILIEIFIIVGAYLSIKSVFQIVKINKL